LLFLSRLFYFYLLCARNVWERGRSSEDKSNDVWCLAIYLGFFFLSTLPSSRGCTFYIHFMPPHPVCVIIL